MSAASTDLDNRDHWEWVKKQEQATLARFARKHRKQNGYCESVAKKTDKGRRVTPRQSAVLWKIATEQGWKIPAVRSVGTGATR